MIPWVVDFKKGIELIKNRKMWHIPTKAEEKEAKRFVKCINKEYRQSGSKDSYGLWAVKKGYTKKPIVPLCENKSRGEGSDTIIRV